MIRMKNLYPMLVVLSFSCRLLGTESCIIFTPSNPEIWENSSLTLSCYTDDASTPRYMYWILNNRKYKVDFSDNHCGAANSPLNETGLYKLYCQSSKNFSLTILKVDRQQHLDTWRCIVGFCSSQTVMISVSVPVQSVNIGLAYGNIKEENQLLRADCMTSYNRPLADIQWFLTNGTSELSDNINLAAHTKEIYKNMTIESNEERSSILTATISILIYKVKRWMDGREIYCVANNSLDRRIISTGKTLNITYPPDGPPHIQGVGSSETYSVINKRQEQLTCVVMGGNPLSSLNWHCAINGTQTTTVSNRTVSKDLIWIATIDNTGICTCQSTYKETTSSVFIHINVLYSPNHFKFGLKYLFGNIVNVSGHISVIEHTPFALTCNASGIPLPASYSWSGPFSSTANTLVIQDVARNHAGNLTCKASNSMQPSSGKTLDGTGLGVIAMSILYPPTVGQLDNISLSEGQPLEVRCRSTPGNPSFTRYKWTNKDKTKWHGEHLIIKNVSRADDGEYTCTAYNDMEPTARTMTHGNTSSSFHLNVLYEATVMQFFIVGYEEQQNVIVNENEKVRFICDVAGNPEAAITLFYESKNEIYEMQNAKRLTYEKENVTCLQAGIYTCTGKNVHNNGQPSLAFLSLQVRCSPGRSPKTSPTTIEPHLNSPATLSFTAMAYPHPGPSGFVWYKQNNSVWILLTYSTKHEISSSELQSNLTISSVTESDYGEYMLRVENSIGRYEQTFSLLKPADEYSARKEGNVPVLYIVIGCLAFILIIAAVSVLIVLGYRRKKNTDSGRTDNHSPYSEVSEMQTISESGKQAKNEQTYETLKSEDDIGGIQTKAVYTNLVM